jgi:NADH-quinone oxidoreductase subunit I
MIHSFIALIPEKCTSCMLCVRECPAWCIHLESHTEEVSEPGARRPKKVNVLDSFDIDYSLCMYCGICVDVCPFDALEWDQHRALTGSTREELYLTKDELAPEQ